jgi:hypothetical protein
MKLKSLPSHSAMLTPEPPISFGTSFMLGNRPLYAFPLLIMYLDDDPRREDGPQLFIPICSSAKFPGLSEAPRLR